MKHLVEAAAGLHVPIVWLAQQSETLVSRSHKWAVGFFLTLAVPRVLC